MIRIPEQRAPMVFGIIQAGLTSLVASGIGVYQLMGLGMGFALSWITAWLIAWMTMLPVVIFAAPHIQRMVLSIIRWSNRFGVALANDLLASRRPSHPLAGQESRGGERSEPGGGRAILSGEGSATPTRPCAALRATRPARRQDGRASFIGQSRCAHVVHGMRELATSPRVCNQARIEKMRILVAGARFELTTFRPGDDLLSQVLRHSTIGAEEFNGRVRDGIGFGLLARATRPAKDLGAIKLEQAISTGQLRGLPRFHIRPINVVVYHGFSGRTHLEVGFPLRCLQRLSRPYIATLHCGWRHNRSTR
eukprot:gene38994-51284_t